jgi:hypothetical protein
MMKAHSRNTNTSTTTQTVTGPASPRNGSARVVTAPPPTAARVACPGCRFSRSGRPGGVRAATPGPQHLDDHR